MSWLFSQALVAEYSAATSWDGAPSAPLSVMPTPHKFSRNDKTMEPSDLSRFGLTCAVLTEDRGEALLTWYRAGFPARTSAQQEKAQDSLGSEAGSGEKWRASLARYDRLSCSWKTAQSSLLGGSELFSGTWPKWGLMRDGECWELTIQAPDMSEKESGFLPTPTKRDSRTLSGSQPPRRAPTSGLPLAWTIALTLRKKDRKGGRLNPQWIEWFMGWPVGWTDLAPLAMDKFREWQQQHGGS